jgi:hypothetical protein
MGGGAGGVPIANLRLSDSLEMALLSWFPAL